MAFRVFVSSVMEGFQEYREAARRGITAAGADPVLIEDFPSLPVSSRTACLDCVASCDCYLLVIAERGGWTAPSGKLVVEEEYEEALGRRLPVLAFVKNCARDNDAQRLLKKVSDYIEGVYRPPFNSPIDLQTAVEKALVPLVAYYKNPKVDTGMIKEILENPHSIGNEATLRFALVPERVEDFLDPVSLDSPELKRLLYELGHSENVGLFSYERPKEAEIEVNELIITQSEEGHRREGKDEVRLEIRTSGVIIIDINVSGRPKKTRSDDISSFHVILEEDVAAALEKCFAFANGFFSMKDPYKRYDRFLYNAALCNLEYRTLLKEPPKNGTYSMGSHSREAIPAFDMERLITRPSLADCGKEIQNILALFRRRLKKTSY